MEDIINDLKKSDIWKIPLKIAINFTPSKDNAEECVMLSKSDKIEIMCHDKADRAIEKLFESIFSKY